jgi:hypothetical protein
MSVVEIVMIVSVFGVAAICTGLAVNLFFGHYWYRWRHLDDDRPSCSRCASGCDGNCQQDWCGAVEDVRYH